MTLSLEQQVADKVTTTLVEHEALFDVTVRRNGRKCTVSIDEGIEVCYDRQVLEQNPAEYITNLRKSEEGFLHAFRSVVAFASTDLNRLRVINQGLISTKPNNAFLLLWQAAYLPIKLFTKKPLEQQLYQKHVLSFQKMMDNYASLQTIFSDGQEIMEDYFHARESALSPELREETAKSIILAKRISDMYSELHGLAKQRRNEKERWWYHYFPKQRGIIGR